MHLGRKTEQTAILYTFCALKKPIMIIFVHLKGNMCVYIHKYIHTYIDIYMYRYIYVYMYTYVLLL